MRTKPFASDQKGQATAELALTIPIFLAFMLVLGDMVGICYNWVCLQYAVNEGARFGSLGKSSGSIEAKVADVARALGVKTEVAVSLTDSVGGSTPGAPLTFSYLIAQTTIRLNPLSNLFLQVAGDYSGNYVVTAQALTRNEPFT